MLAGGFPARSSLAQSASFQEHAPGGAASVFDAYRTARASSSPDEAATLDARLDTYWLFDAINQSLDSKDLERALAHAQDVTERYLLCVQQGTAAQECATQVDPQGHGKAQTP